MITVNSRKYDGSIRRSWQCELVKFDGIRLDVRGTFEHTVEHPDLGRIVRGTLSYERFWLDRWYNVFQFEEPDGTFRNSYFNITMPPSFNGSTIDFVDLDIDIVVWADGSRQILDRDEFDTNAAKFGYPESVVAMALKTLDDVLSELETGYESWIRRA